MPLKRVSSVERIKLLEPEMTTFVVEWYSTKEGKTYLDFARWKGNHLEYRDGDAEDNPTWAIWDLDTFIEHNRIISIYKIVPESEEKQ